MLAGTGSVLFTKPEISNNIYSEIFLMLFKDELIENSFGGALRIESLNAAVTII